MTPTATGAGPNDHRYTNWPSGLAAITLVVDDLTEAKDFYATTFDLPVHYEDDSSVVFKFPNVLINLLHASAAPELIEPAAVAPRDAGNRTVFTLEVDDVDTTCERLRALGVELLNGPMDRPWGPRTASFQDPGGHIWEIGH